MPSKALKHAQRAVQLEPKHAGYHRLAGWLHLTLGDVESAKVEYAEAVQHCSTEKEKYATLAGMHRFMGNDQQAIENATNYLALVEPEKEPWMLQKRANAYKSLGEIDNALADYNRLIQLKPNSHYAYEGRASIRLDQERYQEALNDLDKALQLVPSRSWTYKRRALAHFHLGNYDHALADIRKACQGNPEDASNLYWIPPRLVARCSDDSFRNAMLELADQAVGQADTAGVRRGRAALLLGFDQYERAMADLKAAIDKEPSDYYARYQYALASLATGNRSTYRNECRQMLEQFAESESSRELHFTVRTCALAPGSVDDWSPAIRLAERAVSAAPEDVGSRQALGAILFRDGQYAEALPHLEQATASEIAQKTSSAYGWFFLAMTHHKLADEEQAHTWYEKAAQHTENVRRRGEPEEYVPWNRRLTLQLLRDEAKQLLDESAAGAELDGKQEPTND